MILWRNRSQEYVCEVSGLVAFVPPLGHELELKRARRKSAGRANASIVSGASAAEAVQPRRAPATPHTVEPPHDYSQSASCGLGARRKSKMIIPVEIMDAACDGDIQTVVRFLDEGGDINAFDARGETLLRSVAYSHVDVCRVLVARGADPNRFGQNMLSPLCQAILFADGGLSNPRQGGGAAWSASPSGELFHILVESGADLNARDSIRWGTDYSHEGHGSLLARILIDFGDIDFGDPDDQDPSLFPEIVTALLRAGARVDSIFEDQGETYSALWCLNLALAMGPELAQDEHYAKTRELIVGVYEDGSFKRFMRRPHRSVLRLRSLFARGRATPKKWSPRGYDRRAIESLVKLPDNGILWNILSFWRAST